MFVLGFLLKLYLVSGSAEFRRYAFYTVKPMVLAFSAFAQIVDVFKIRHRFLDVVALFFMILTVVRRLRFQNVFGIDFQMVSGAVLASILHSLEVLTPKKSIPKQR